MAARKVASVEEANAALAEIVAGRRWVICSQVAALGTAVERLRELGAKDVLVVAASEGVGERPDCEVALLDRPKAATIMDGIRDFEGVLANPPTDVVQMLDRFDPDGSAWVLLDSFMTVRTVAGRHVHGARSPAWLALEDKTTIDGVWDAVGVARAPSAVVSVDDAGPVTSELDGGAGTVWAADNRDGWHGGGDYTRWLGPGEDPTDLVEWFGARADHVRVMPLLEGLPCSIHGFVTESATVAFRPYELLVFRDPDTWSFVYAGGATFWDPPGADRDEMRAIARKVGAHIGGQLGYRGPFSVDGVLTADGFRPTELNPRLSRGFGDQATAVEGLSVMGLTRALLDGLVDVDADWLEETVVNAADAARVGRAGLSVEGSPPEVDPVEVSFADGVPVEVDEGPEALVAVGPGPMGTYVSVTLDAERVAPGPSVAPLAKAGFELAAERWGVAVPRLVAAGDRAQGTTMQA